MVLPVVGFIQEKVFRYTSLNFMATNCIFL